MIGIVATQVTTTQGKLFSQHFELSKNFNELIN